MPRGDGTGPDGNGPKTGRGLGPCKPAKDTPKQDNVRRGLGRGLRNRRGFGNSNR